MICYRLSPTPTTDPSVPVWALFVKKPDLRLGRIVYARVVDSDGQTREMKRRPLVVICAPQAGSDTFVWLACSTKAPPDAELAYSIPLDYKATPGGHRYTHFGEPTYLYCRWTGVMRLDEILNPTQDIRGTLHSVQIELMLEIIGKLQADLASNAISMRCTL